MWSLCLCSYFIYWKKWGIFGVLHSVVPSLTGFRDAGWPWGNAYGQGTVGSSEGFCVDMARCHARDPGARVAPRRNITWDLRYLAAFPELASAWLRDAAFLLLLPALPCVPRAPHRAGTGTGPELPRTSM